MSSLVNDRQIQSASIITFYNFCSVWLFGVIHGAFPSASSITFYDKYQLSNYIYIYIFCWVTYTRYIFLGHVGKNSISEGREGRTCIGPSNTHVSSGRMTCEGPSVLLAIVTGSWCFHNTQLQDG